MKQGFKVMDSDMHIIEPPDLWQCYIEPEFKGQAPRGPTNSVGDLGMVGPDGTPRGRNLKNVQNLGQDRWRGHSFARNQERFKPYEDMGWTRDTQLWAMDEEDNLSPKATRTLPAQIRRGTGTPGIFIRTQASS